VNSRIVTNLLDRLRVACSRCNTDMARGDFGSHKSQCPFQCPYGCGVSLTPLTAHEHEKKCDYVLVCCSANSLGCTDNVPRCKLKEHQETCKWENSRWIIEPLQHRMKQLYDDHVTVRRMLNDQNKQINQLSKSQEEVLELLEEKEK
jgi:hypothetical protein